MIRKRARTRERKKLSFNEMMKKTQEKGTSYDSYILNNYNLFKLKEGPMTLRILEPTWDGDGFHSYKISVHQKIGPDNAQYLCLKMIDQPCPICEDREANADDFDYVTALKPKNRYVAWVINRDDEKAGPLLWSMAWTVNRDIIEVSVDRRAQKNHQIDDFDKGYDLDFLVKKITSPKFNGLTIDNFVLSRTQTPALSDPTELDELIKFVEDHPVDKCFNFYDYDYLKKIHIQHNKDESKTTDSDSIGAEVEEENDIPFEDDSNVSESKLTWESIHALDSDDLDKLALEDNLDPQAYGTDDDLADEICKVRKITNPNSNRKKLRGLRDRVNA